MEQEQHPGRTPALAATAAAAAGLAGGLAIGARRRRSPVRDIAHTLAQLHRDLYAVRQQAELSQKQSPVEVVLSALTSRRLPRHG